MYALTTVSASKGMRVSASNAPINLKPVGGGGGRAWGGDLIVIVDPGVGLLTDLAFPGEGIFESVFTQCGDIEHRLE